ncbi:MAG: ribosomal protein L7/L12 [Alphaproteobacteria bacterium]|nr:MAG: ribosomal protein L7/L12 [Alphaproteobacteria bacterium]
MNVQLNKDGFIKAFLGLNSEDRIDVMVSISAELTNSETVNVVNALAEKYGVNPDIAASSSSDSSSTQEVVEEKSSFSVIIESAGSQKVQVIKAIKEILKCSLGDAKAKAEEAGASLGEFDKAKADEIAAALTSAGAKVVLK